MFSLDEEQEEKLAAWLNENKVLERYGGTIGGHLTYSFTPTNLGVIVTVEENFGHTKIDLTDYDSW